MATHILDSQNATYRPVPAPTMNAAAQQQAVAAQSTLWSDGSKQPDLVSEAVSMAGVTTNTSTSTATGTRTISTSAIVSDDVRKNKASSTAAASTISWHWNGGSFGCADGTPSGTAYVCHATGTAQKRGVMETMEKRQSDGSPDLSGNGGPPIDIINKDSPDIGWLDLIVGAIPYKNGDLAPSIVWILATLFLIPFFLVRILRRSSLVSHVLLFVFIWGTVMVVTFGIRAYLANGNLKTSLISAQNIMLQILPCLLIEPLLNLLALYAQQGGFPTGVPRVAFFLRFLNVVAIVLYAVAAAYFTQWLNAWDDALMSPNQIGDRSEFPSTYPSQFIRIGPIIAAFIQIVCSIGALLLIPIARGENGSMRPGGFIAVLVILVTIPVIYRILQTLHAQSELSEESGNNSNPFTELTRVSSTMSGAAVNAVMNLVPVAAIAPPGMYSPDSNGIDWSQLQQTLASRGRIQSPIVFNLVFIFPQWLQTFLFFFVHAPGSEGSNKLAPVSQQP
jgi:hypothetical protein